MIILRLLVLEKKEDNLRTIKTRKKREKKEEIRVRFYPIKFYPDPFPLSSRPADKGLSKETFVKIIVLQSNLLFPEISISAISKDY